MSFNFAVALPLIGRAEWRDRGFDHLTGDAVLLREDLYPGSIRASLEQLAAGHPQQPLAPKQWGWARAVLHGQLPSSSQRHAPANAPNDNPARILRSIEEGVKILDVGQTQAAYEVPEGPQRLRGLAGTGKTVMLCQRAAKIHARHPDWRVGFVFST